MASFKAKYGGTPAAIKAAELLMKLPSPLDQLDAKRLPQDCIDYWRAAGREPPGELVGVLGEHRRRHWGAVQCVAYSPAAKLVASASEDKQILLWDAETMQPRAMLSGHTAAVSCLAFSPNGKILASGSEDPVRLWDVQTHKELRSLPHSNCWTKSLAFSPDGQHLITGGQLPVVAERPIRVWDAETGKELGSIIVDGRAPGGNPILVWSLAFSPDGRRILSGSNDRSVRVWDAQSRKQLQRFDGLKSGGIGFTQDGNLFFAGRLWDADTRKELQRYGNGAFLCGDGRFVIHDGKLYQAATGKELIRLDGYQGQVACYLVDEQRIVSGAADGAVRLWDVATGKEMQPLRGAVSPLNTVAFSADNRLLIAAGADGTARVWDPVLGNETGRIPCHHAWFTSGTAAYLGIGPEIRLYSFNPQEQVRGELGQVTVVAIAGDGQTIACARPDTAIEILSLGAAKPRAVLRGQGKRIDALAFSPNGRMLASGSEDELVRLWNLDRPEPRERAALDFNEPGTHWVAALAFAPDGKTLAVGYQHAFNQIRLWDVSGPQPKPMHASEKHSKNLTSIAYAPDGRTIVSAGHDGRIMLFDTGSGNKLRQWQLPGSVAGIAFAADGRHLATANGNGTVYILRIAPPLGLQ